MHRITQLRVKRAIGRLLLAIFLPALILLALRLFWGWEASHRLAATKSALLSQDIRLYPIQQSIPDNQNAAVAVQQALNAVTLTSVEESLVTGKGSSRPIGEITWTDEEKPRVRAILAKNARAFDALRIAAVRTQAQWPDTRSAKFQNARKLASLLYDAALIAHEDHEDAAALEYLRLILVLADTVDQQATLIAHLVSAAERNFVAMGIERLDPNLHMANNPAALDAAGKLLLALPVSAHYRQTPAIAWGCEIGFETDHEELEKIAEGSFRWWFRPLFQDETARKMKVMSKDLPSLRVDDWQTAAALIPTPIVMPPSNLNGSVFLISSQAPSSWQFNKIHFRSLSDTAAATLLLGARIFEARHSVLPRQSRDLIPEVLAVAPIDPFAADHRPMQLRLGPDGPTVWSVGENGTDEGGSVFFEPTTRERRRYATSSDPARNPPDIVYGAAWRTASPPPRPSPPPAASPSPFAPPPPPD